MLVPKVERFVLTVENPHPARSPYVVQFCGHKLRTVKTHAAGYLRQFAERFGVSPLSLDWKLEVAR